MPSLQVTAVDWCRPTNTQPQQRLSSVGLSTGLSDVLPPVIITILHYYFYRPTIKQQIEQNVTTTESTAERLRRIETIVIKEDLKRLLYRMETVVFKRESKRLLYTIKTVVFKRD